LPIYRAGDVLFLRVLVWFGIVGFGALLAAGFAGAIHPAGDSFAVFRAQAAAGLMGCALLGVILRMRKVGVVCGMVALVTATPVASAYLRSGPSGGLVIYQKNLLYIDSDLAAIAADIRETAPDFVTLQEVSDRNRPLLRDLRDSYRTQLYCPFRGVVVMSRFAAVPGKSVCGPGLSAMQVETGEGPLWVISVHLFWPWPFDQALQVQELSELIAGLDGPKVIAGDFNMVPWSDTMHKIATAGGVQFARPLHVTFPGFGALLGLPIDHVLTPAGGNTELRPLFGSDHHGVLVRFGLPQPESAASNG
jgi:endonuclease/exonuclease/phosphatase (EEP) superfamily protein YafD